MDLPIMENYVWPQNICVLLWLASFTYLNVFKIHTCRGMYEDCILFPCQIVFHCMYNIVICNTKHIFGLCAHFWQRAPKLFGISQVMRAMKMSFVMLLRGHLELSQHGCWENQPGSWRTGIFCPTSRELNGLENE